MGTDKNDINKKWAALAKQLFDERTAEKSNLELTDWEPDELNDIRETARQIDLHFKQKRFSPEQDLPKVEAAIHQNSETKVFRLSSVWRRIAAVILVGLLVGSVAYWASEAGWLNAQEEVAAVDNYGLTKIELADGSMVTLNYGSHLSYPDHFTGKYREVELDGEGFFEVLPNPDQPFIIHAGKADIQVLGTSFNVNAYPQTGEVSVVVKTGRVQVSSSEIASTDDDVILTPGEKGVLNDDSPQFQRIQNDDLNYLAWKTHSFIFNKTSLKDVIEQLNKVYRVEIATADPEMEKLLLTARFDDRPVRFILEVIAMTHKLELDQIDESNYLLQKN
ncbi:FecR family protein [Mangrovibacterium lignilyticum]|uniref:FecR family protein n=1 Tax=Mangrovibacterium lignilyticum TaxID=2668052 RepID=UPI0013D42556|nr:FecR domain-containing protein [Mangrovibacterium lignilyticum]